MKEGGAGWRIMNVTGRCLFLISSQKRNRLVLVVRSAFTKMKEDAVALDHRTFTRRYLQESVITMTVALIR